MHPSKKRRRHEIVDREEATPVEPLESLAFHVRKGRRVWDSNIHDQRVDVPESALQLGSGIPQLSESDYLGETDGDAGIEEGEGGEFTVIVQPKRRGVTVRPMIEWIPFREHFLDKIMRLEAPEASVQALACVTCHAECEAPFRCDDCFGGHLSCQQCLVDGHAGHPLHRIKMWNGSFFARTSLATVGLRVQLGYHGERCYAPTAAHTDFVVIDTSGIHSVAVDYCGCGLAIPESDQLLRVRWYPATSKFPRTACTFRALKLFHLLTLQGKLSAYDFYTLLSRLTDNSGVTSPPNRYPSFMRCIRQWRHLSMLKRSARAHDPAGAAATSAGELALRCLACPHPEWNMADDWRETPPERRYLNAMLLSMDANFRMRRKLVSSDTADPALGSGWGYFVEEKAYKSHLAVAPLQHETSTCHSHHAHTHADVDSKGYSTSGVGAVTCARHQLFLPNGVSDLQKGERYLNMDYIFASAVYLLDFMCLVVSYDIACQWIRHLGERLAVLPAPPAFTLGSISFLALVPKFHLAAHILGCQLLYSFNLHPGVGRTDGEGIERDWSNMNPVASSTREMGPGSRHDTLEDHFGDWNHRRVVGMGHSLRKRMDVALRARDKHARTFEELSQSIPDAQTQQWMVMVQEWEQAPNTAPNPYKMDIQTLSQADIRKELAEDEAHTVSGSHTGNSVDDTSPTVFLCKGIDLEETQARLAVEVTNARHPTSTQAAALQQSRNSLRRKIEEFRKLQAIFMPMGAQADSVDGNAVLAERIPLGLPSQLTDASLRSQCAPGLLDKEWRLRRGQAEDALADIRRSLCVRSHMSAYRRESVRGQHANTRHNGRASRAKMRTDRHADTYRRAREALLRLDPDREDWQSSLRPLAATDLEPLHVGLYADDDARKKKADVRKQLSQRSEGNREIAWIWQAPGALDNASRERNWEGVDGLHDALRIKWARSRARRDRWNEEVLLLEAEMKRVLEYFRRRADWWEEQRSRRDSVPGSPRAGLQAYASAQAERLRGLRERFAVMWGRHMEGVPAMWMAPSGAQGVSNESPMELEPDDVLFSDNAMDEAHYSAACAHNMDGELHDD